MYNVIFTVHSPDIVQGFYFFSLSLTQIIEYITNVQHHHNLKRGISKKTKNKQPIHFHQLKHM